MPGLRFEKVFFSCCYTFLVGLFVFGEDVPLPPRSLLAKWGLGEVADVFTAFFHARKE